MIARDWRTPTVVLVASALVLSASADSNSHSRQPSRAYCLMRDVSRTRGVGEKRASGLPTTFLPQEPVFRTSRLARKWLLLSATSANSNECLREAG